MKGGRADGIRGHEYILSDIGSDQEPDPATICSRAPTRVAFPVDRGTAKTTNSSVVMSAALVITLLPVSRTNALFAAVSTFWSALTVKLSLRSMTPKTSASPLACRTAYTELGSTRCSWLKSAWDATALATPAAPARTWLAKGSAANGSLSTDLAGKAIWAA